MKKIKTRKGGDIKWQPKKERKPLREPLEKQRRKQKKEVSEESDNFFFIKNPVSRGFLFYFARVHSKQPKKNPKKNA